MDLKVAFTSQDTVPDVDHALASVKRLAERLHIAYRKADIEPRNILLSHGFYPVDGAHFNSETGKSPKEMIETLSDGERETLGFRKVRGRWYRTMNAPLEQNPYYQLRVGMLADGVEEQACRLEARGFTLALHPLMYTFDLRFITLQFEDMTGKKTTCGSFVGQVFYADTDTPLPSSEIEERTGLFGPLVHMQLVEFLAALKREAIPSLYIRDPSGYLETGNVGELVTACKQAGMTLTHFWNALSQSENATPEEAFFKGNLDLPEHSRPPVLEGTVGSEERLRQLGNFLVTHGHLLPDIDKLLADGR
jgi:hypothetical protein